MATTKQLRKGTSQAKTKTGKPQRPATKQKPTASNVKAQDQTAYRPHFSDDEIKRIISSFNSSDGADDAISNTGLDAVTDATYVLLDRIIARMSAMPDDDDPAAEGDGTESFLKLVRAHNETTGRVAQLLRTRRVISGKVGEALSDNIAAALDQLAELFNQNL